MPGYSSHVAAALVLWAAAVCFLGLELSWLLLLSFAVAGFGGLFPDVDSQSSRINNFIELCIGAGIFVAVVSYFLFSVDVLLLGVLVASAFLVVMQLLSHRGVFHKWWFCAAVAGLVACFSVLLGAAFAAGAFSHLLLDKVF